MKYLCHHEYANGIHCKLRNTHQPSICKSCRESRLLFPTMAERQSSPKEHARPVVRPAKILHAYKQGLKLFQIYSNQKRKWDRIMNMAFAF